MSLEEFLQHWKNRYPNTLPEEKEPHLYGNSFYINVKCPYCLEMGKGPDKGQHCHAHYEKEWFKCQRCGKGGTLHFLLGLRKEKPVNKEPWGYYVSTPENREKNKKTIVRAKGLETTHIKPGATIPIEDLPKNHVAWKYLISEGFNEKEILSLAELYGIYYCIKGWEFDKENSTTHRLIFEISENNTAYGWQARWLPSQWPKSTEDLKKEKQIKKYLISPRLKKTFLLYNWDLAQEWDMLILVEGIKKVWKTGKFALAPFGISNSVTPPEGLNNKDYNQFWSVRLKNSGKPVGILYDKGALSTSLSHTEKLKEMGIDAKTIPLPETGAEDLDEYHTQEIRQLIKNTMGRLPKKLR